jgi:hypothetical protein
MSQLKQVYARCHVSGSNRKISGILSRLKAYQNTGMTPEEAVEWRNQALKDKAKLDEIITVFKLDCIKD